MEHNPHVLVADWFAPDFEIERTRFEDAGVTWSSPEVPFSGQSVAEQIEQLLVRIRNSPRIDAVLFVLAPLTRAVIEALPPMCLHLQRVGIGLDTVDLEAARERGITVSNTPDYATEEVALHALAMILSLHRQLGATERRLRAGEWRVQPPEAIERLSTLTLGLVGLGRIGGELARLMEPMVRRILYCDPMVKERKGADAVEFSELLQSSDIVSLHCPLLPETRYLIREETIAQMKPTALLINVARGALVDPCALAAALREKRLAGAGLDVYEPEVLPSDSPLRALNNVILTSHTAWFSRHSLIQCREQAAAKLVEAICSQKPALNPI